MSALLLFLNKPHTTLEFIKKLPGCLAKNNTPALLNFRIPSTNFATLRFIRISLTGIFLANPANNKY